MGADRSLRHGGALCAVAAIVAAVSCLDPTEVTLVITTDVPCSLNRGTSITVGGASDDLTSKPPLTVTQDCTLVSPDVDDSGALTKPANIGTLVIVPSGGRGDSFTVQIVTAVDPNMSPTDCMQSRTNCIFASREISFIPHTPITLPIEITLDCKNIDCMQGQTCDHGRCVANSVQVMCTGGGVCNGIIPPDASSPPPESGALPDASAETSELDASVRDQLVIDQTVGSEIPDVMTNEGANGDEPDADTTDVSIETAPADVTTADVTTQDAPLADAFADATPDAIGADGPRETSTTDGPSDAPAEAAPDAQETGTTPSDSGFESDASPLGTCPTAGPSNVTCAGSACASGQVCCVIAPSLSVPTESCTTLTACTSTPVGTPYAALGCRNLGDCPSGQVCCFTAGTGSGATATCSTTCTNNITTKTACRHSCECTGGNNVCNPKICFGANLGVCGVSAGSSCP